LFTNLQDSAGTEVDAAQVVGVPVRVPAQQRLDRGTYHLLPCTVLQCHKTLLNFFSLFRISNLYSTLQAMYSSSTKVRVVQQQWMNEGGGGYYYY
jgi:hypothetical protein